MTDSTKGAATSKEYTLDRDCELRFEVESKTQVVVEVCLFVYVSRFPFHVKLILISTFQLKNGFAELYGTELVKAKKYAFTQGAKVAIFSYQGCVLIIRGTPDACYIARETPMIQYLNTHSAIEQMRVKAEERGTRGPIVLIVGPTDVGKVRVQFSIFVLI